MTTMPVNLADFASLATLDGIRTIAQEVGRRRKDAARKRRERRWNKVLGRRADGHVIRPIK